MRERYEGRIAGVGSSSGVRLVVGRWDVSPHGSFADVMVERADGHRILLAPSAAVRATVEATYTFDEVRLEDVTLADTADGWSVRAPSLELDLTIGSRMPLGHLLRLVPRPLATSTAWATLLDPVASRVLDGVHTRGAAREGRKEWYGATDLRAVTAMSGRLDGVALGSLTDVDPPCRFGFSSTPRSPSVTHVVTTIEIA